MNALANDGVIDPNVIWTKKSISVCWAGKEKIRLLNPNFVSFLEDENIPTVYLDENLKSKIQNKINEQYSIQKTGVEFTGWNNCAENSSNADIAIFGLKEFRSTPEFRTYLKKVANEIPDLLYVANGSVDKIGHKAKMVYFGLNHNSSLEVEISDMITAVHEFGHLAGLQHEHLRPEKPSDCSQDSKPYAAMKVYTKYDDKSIMNYRYGELLRSPENKTTLNDIKLSEGDVHTLRCVYIPDQESNCEEYNW